MPAAPTAGFLPAELQFQPRSITTRKLKVVVPIRFISFLTWAESPSASAPVIEAPVDTLMSDSLQEKLDLIGGVNDFYIRESKHIGCLH